MTAVSRVMLRMKNIATSYTTGANQEMDSVAVKEFLPRERSISKSGSC